MGKRKRRGAAAGFGCGKPDSLSSAGATEEFGELGELGFERPLSGNDISSQFFPRLRRARSSACRPGKVPSCGDTTDGRGRSRGDAPLGGTRAWSGSQNPHGHHRVGSLDGLGKAVGGVPRSQTVACRSRWSTSDRPAAGIGGQDLPGVEIQKRAVEDGQGTFAEVVSDQDGDFKRRSRPALLIEALSRLDRQLGMHAVLVERQGRPRRVASSAHSCIEESRAPLARCAPRGCGGRLWVWEPARRAAGRQGGRD